MPIKKILVVDDASAVRKLVVNAFASLPYHVVELTSAEGLTERIRHEAPHLALIAVEQMVRAQGLGLCQDLKASSRDGQLLVFLLASDIEDSERERMFAWGADDVIVKPFSPLELVAKVEDGLRRQGAPGDAGHTLAPSSLSTQAVYREHTDGAVSDGERGAHGADDLLRLLRDEQARNRQLKAALEQVRAEKRQQALFLSLSSHRLEASSSILRGYLKILEQVTLESAQDNEGASTASPVGLDDPTAEPNATPSPGGVDASASLPRRRAPASAPFVTATLDALVRLGEQISEMAECFPSAPVYNLQAAEVQVPALLATLIKEVIASRPGQGVASFSLEGSKTCRPVVLDPHGCRELFRTLLGHLVCTVDPAARVILRVSEDDTAVTVTVRVAQARAQAHEPGWVSELSSAADTPAAPYETGGEPMPVALAIVRHLAEELGGRVVFASISSCELSLELRRSRPRAEGPSRVVGTDLRTLEGQLARLTSASQHHLVEQVRSLSAQFAEQQAANRVLQDSLSGLEKTYIETIAAFASVADAMDSYSLGHTDRVAQCARAIATQLDPNLLLDRDFNFSLLLHDLGKIGIGEDLLKKAGRLSEAEWETLKSHTDAGVDFLASVELLQPALVAVRSHHERWDGKGYPDGLQGEEIPLVSRIIALADAFEAITSDRPYRKGLAPEEARDEVISQAGTQFDPLIIEAFRKAWPDIASLKAVQA